jgi:hypothetical protein
LEGPKLKDIKIKKNTKKTRSTGFQPKSACLFLKKKKEREIDDALFVFT